MSFEVVLITHFRKFNLHNLIQVSFLHNPRQFLFFYQGNGRNNDGKISLEKIFVVRGGRFPYYTSTECERNNGFPAFSAHNISLLFSYYEHFPGLDDFFLLDMLTTRSVFRFLGRITYRNLQLAHYISKTNHLSNFLCRYPLFHNARVL